MFFESSPLHKVLHLDIRQVEFYGKLKDVEKKYSFGAIFFRSEY